MPLLFAPREQQKSYIKNYIKVTYSRRILYAYYTHIIIHILYAYYNTHLIRILYAY